MVGEVGIGGGACGLLLSPSSSLKVFGMGSTMEFAIICLNVPNEIPWIACRQVATQYFGSG